MSIVGRETLGGRRQVDDGYGACSHCLWNGKLRQDGTMRRHRDQRRSADGSQRCAGEGKRPIEFAARLTN